MKACQRLGLLRSNPLCRSEDVVEAWIMLAVWSVVLLGGAVAGVVAAHAAADVFARQRADRHAVRAVLLDAAATGAGAIRSDDGRVRARVRWTAPDGGAHTGETFVDAGLPAGSRVTVWEDGRGRLAPAKPTGRVEGTMEAGFFGLAAALGVAGPVYGAGALARHRLDRRRLAAWDREWRQVGPRWSHRTG
ncbi:Rv1733c family protein [Streptomyces sp. NPDC001606]